LVGAIFATESYIASMAMPLFERTTINRHTHCT